MSLIAHYPLIDNSKDYSGNKYDMTHDEIATGTDGGKIGKCYVFPGDGKHVSCSNNFKSSEMTFAFWVNVSQTSYGTTVFRMTDDCLAADYSYNNFRFFMYGTDNNPYVCEFSDTEVNRWNHFTCIYKPGSLSVYKNGIFKKSINVVLKPRDAGYRLTVGCRGDREFPLNGKLNDFRIYNHALSIKEIKELAKAKILHYKFDECKEAFKNLAGSKVNFANGWGGYQGSSAVITQNQSVPEWGTNKATRIVGSAEGGKLKWFTNWMCPGGSSEGLKMSTSVKVKNIGKTKCRVHSQYGVSQIVKPGEIIHYKASVTCNGTSCFQLRFEAVDNDTDIIDILAYQPTYAHSDFAFTDYTDTEKSNVTIADSSGFENHGSISMQTSPQWSNDSKIGKGCYKFINKHNQITCKTPGMLLNEFSFSIWIKENSYLAGYPLFKSSSLLFHMDSSTSIRVRTCDSAWGTEIAGTTGTRTGWHHYAFTFNNGVQKLYYDGKQIAISNSGASKINWNSSSNLLIGYRNDGGAYSNLDAYIDDLRLYVTALSDEEIANMCNSKAAIAKDGTFLVNNIETSFNVWERYNNAIKEKTFKDGLDKHEQAHAKCSLTDEGYRIVRTPNLVHSVAGNVMWGGMRLFIPNGMIAADTDYMITFKYKGKSTNPMETYFAYDVGWIGKGGLAGNYPSGNIQKANFNSDEWHTGTLKFKFTQSQIYRVATKTESDVVAGETYSCVRTFRIGYTYNDTGTLGTDIYIKDLKLIDVTNKNLVGVEKNGTLVATAFNEVGITDSMIAYYPLDKDVKDYSGNKKHLSGTYISSSGIKNKSHNSTGTTSGLRVQMPIGETVTVSAWGMHIDNDTSKMLFSFNSDTVSGPDLYFAHDVISLNTGDGGSNPFKKNNVSQAYTTPNIWHHYCVVIDKSKNKATLYIDGEFAGDALYKSPAQSATKYFTVGCYYNNSSYIWKGQIDEVKVFNRALTADEVKIEYKTTGLKQVLINKDGTVYANSFNEVLI